MQARENPYGKSGNIETKQIIDRILSQHFSTDPHRERTIGEMETEIAGMVVQRAQFVDFGNGENCEFK